MEKIWFVLLATGGNEWHATTDDVQSKKHVKALCGAEGDATRATDNPTNAEPCHEDCRRALAERYDPASSN